MRKKKNYKLKKREICLKKKRYFKGAISSLRPEVLRHTTRSSSKSHLESTDSNPNFQDVKVFQTHVDLKFKLLNALNITSPYLTSSMKTLVQAQDDKKVAAVNTPRE